MPKYIIQEMARDMGDGKQRIYPKMQIHSQHSYRTVLRHMRQYAGAFSEGTMRGVIDALVTTMVSWMPEGHSIKVDGLGTFSLSLGYDTSDADDADADKEQPHPTDPDDPHRRHVCIRGINFKPDPTLLKQMNHGAVFERAQPKVKQMHRCRLSAAERLDRALALIERNGFMTLDDYARATGLCRSSASVDLKQQLSLPDCPLKTRGLGSHKVWVKA